MPIGKSYSFKFRRGKDTDDEGKAEKTKFKNKNKLKKSLSESEKSGEREGVCQDNSAAVGYSSSLSRQFSFSLQVINELKTNKTFNERLLLEENKISKSYTNLKETGSIKGSILLNNDLSVSNIISSYEKSLNKVENEPKPKKEATELGFRKSCSLSSLTPISEKQIEDTSSTKKSSVSSVTTGLKLKSVPATNYLGGVDASNDAVFARMHKKSPKIAQAINELLKNINQAPKERTESLSENKFPLDDVEYRGRLNIQKNRYSKTTDFDVGAKSLTRTKSPIFNPKNFEIRGIIKIELSILSTKPILIKLKEEYIAYEDENFYRINTKTKQQKLLASNVIIKSVRYPKGKESKEVELKDSKNVTYMLHFQDLKYAKQFMENDKIQVYIADNKITIKKTLLRFLGKRSSREILEKKGIYRNESIFGNTLKDIYIKGGSNLLVPAFIFEVIKLLEKPENIQTMGLYRTSGNLAIIQKIRCEVDNGRLCVLEHYAKDPDVLTGALKLFFRELREPLIPREVCDRLLEFAKLDTKEISSRDHQKIRSILVKNLHEANLETFAVIMRHLQEVIKNKEHNKMDAYNLSVCWGPSMTFAVHGENISPMDLSRDIVTQSQDATRMIDFLLVYYELYPAELGTLGKRQILDTISENVLRRQDSGGSVISCDSPKSSKKSSSSLSLSVDEIAKKLVECIEQHISCEGLYSRSGSSDKTKKIIKILNKKKITELDKYRNDVHELTDALKKYLKEQDCLVSDETIKLVLEASPDSSQSCLERTKRQKVTALIEGSSKTDTLVFLVQHLAKVLDYQEQTHNVPRNDLINIWGAMLSSQKKSKTSVEDFSKFLAIAVKVLNDNLPDVVRSSFNNNGSSPNRNESMDELMKEMKHKTAEKDRNSRYDNVDIDVDETPIVEAKTEQTKL